MASVFILSGCASTSVNEAMTAVGDFFGPRIVEHGSNFFSMKDVQRNGSPQVMLKDLLDKANRYCEKKNKSLRLHNKSSNSEDTPSLTGMVGNSYSVARVSISFSCE